jgi:HEAT repeat protein
MNNKSINESTPFESQIKHWTEEIQEKQDRVDKKTKPAKIILALAVVVGVGSIFILGEYAWIGLVLLIAGISLSTILFIKGSKYRKATVQELVKNIQKELQSEKLEAEEFVKGLYGKTKGKVNQEVLKKIDPDIFGILNLRDKGKKLCTQVSKKEIKPMNINVSATSGSIDKITVDGESEIDEFSSIAVEYLSHKGYVEGIAALAMVQMIYTEMAPPAGELYIHSYEGNQALKDAALQAQKVFSSFDLTPEMKSVKENLARRRSKSILEQLLAKEKQEASQAEAKLSEILDSTQLKVHDPAFVGSCIDYIGKNTKDPLKRNQSYTLIAQIPDIRTMPFLMEGFRQLFFFPQGIEAVSIFGEESYPKLLKALKEGSGSLRFNAAMALGFMNVKNAKSELEKILPEIKDPKERAGVCYALVRLGDKDKLEPIFDTLNNSDKNIRHASAILLEHLSDPLDEKIYLKHLEDENWLVRLRLIRKLGKQGTTNSSLIEALINRFDDENEEVRSAAVTTMGKLNAELVYDRMVELTESGTSNPRLCAFKVLGSLSQPKSISLLTDALSKTYDKDVRRAIISSLGSLNAVEAVDEISEFLDDDDLSRAAFWALLQISFKDKDLVLKHMNGAKHNIKRLFLLSLHGDEKAKRKLDSEVLSSKDPIKLINALEYIQLLKDPIFNRTLLSLLDYRKPERFPGDRYISYMALKGLVHIQTSEI